MLAHQHCDLFYPVVGDLIGSVINWVGFGPPVRDRFLSSKWLIRCSQSA